MFLVIPLVEFRHVLGFDINVHHENPATFLGHMSVSSVKRSLSRFTSFSLPPGPHGWSPGETREINCGSILADAPQIPGPNAIFGLFEVHHTPPPAAALLANPRTTFH